MRKAPRPLAQALVPFIAEIGVKVRQADPDYWRSEGDSAQIDCPCGETHALPHLKLLVGGCGRGFYFAGGDVFVLNPRPAG